MPTEERYIIKKVPMTELESYSNSVIGYALWDIYPLEHNHFLVVLEREED